MSIEPINNNFTKTSQKLNAEAKVPQQITNKENKDHSNISKAEVEVQLLKEIESQKSPIKITEKEDSRDESVSSKLKEIRQQAKADSPGGCNHWGWGDGGSCNHWGFGNSLSILLV